MKRQASVRVSDPDLLAECGELLSRQLGDKLPQATIVSAALIALKNQLSHELISREDCRSIGTQNAVIVCTKMIERLLQAHLLNPGSYVIDAHVERGFLLSKDGVALTGQKPETPPAPPDWVNDFIDKPLKKQSVN